jgi:hypothetical protein
MANPERTQKQRRVYRTVELLGDDILIRNILQSIAAVALKKGEACIASENDGIVPVG